MSWLLAKDRPWVYGGSIVGIGALAAAMLGRSAEHVFVVGAESMEALFHVAWSTGLVLGAVAACFDEVLGTRELLAQRPLARSAAVAARIRGVLVALAAWFVVAPVAAWIIALLFGEAAGSPRLAAVGAVLATSVVAVSGAAIGLAAGSLPAPWWQRLVAAAAWFAATFALVHELARDGSNTRMATFVAAHVGVAALFVAVAAVAARHDADADRPWPRGPRWVAALPAAAALAVLWAACCGEAQGAALRRLEGVYPEIVQLGDRFVLARTLDPARCRAIVDARHEPTGERLDALPPGSETWRVDMVVWGRSFGVDAPRWHHAANTAWRLGTGVVLAADGRVWTRVSRGLRATGRGAEHAPFAAGSGLHTVGDAIVVVDAAARQPWRWDDRLEHFVPLALPANERAVESVVVRLDQPGDERWRALLVQPQSPWIPPAVLRGEHDVYVVADDTLVVVPGLLQRLERDRVVQRARDAQRARFAAEQDPLRQRLEVPPGAAEPAFVHEFRPHTTLEQLHAGTTILGSLVRPPLLQVAGSFGPRPARAAWLFDRLTTDGRRPWLVFATCVLGGLLAWRTARRLQRLGAARTTVCGWAVAVALLGLPALVVSLAIERPRAYARRELAVSPAPPRIRSPSPEEVPA